MPDILDEEVEANTDNEEENMAMTALMDELKLLRQEMNTINETTQSSKSEEINSLKTQISKMAEQFKENENKQLDSLKEEINALKNNQIENERVAKVEQSVVNEESAELDEAQKLIKEIESRKLD